MSVGQDSQASTGDDTAFGVVIFAAADDPHELRDMLAEQLSIHPTDAMILVHATPGILPHKFSKESAEKLVAAIQTLGLRAELVPVGEIPDFEHGADVHHARLYDNGLSILELHGVEETLIPWDEIQLISVGQVPNGVTRHYSNDDVILTAARRRSKAPQDIPTTPTMALWIVCKGCKRGFHIEEGQMNYEDLGDKKVGSATVNFRLFVEEIISRAKSASLTPATRNFLDHGALRHYQFDSDDELKRYTTFHLLLRTRSNGE